MDPRFSHVALTISRDMFEPGPTRELLGFYEDVFGWSEDPSFAKPGERILIRAPSSAQYITLRSAEAPMQTSGYEHLGLWVDTVAEIHALHEAASKAGRSYPDLELGPVRTLYGGGLTTFRLRFRLPLTLELQHAASGTMPS